MKLILITILATVTLIIQMVQASCSVKLEDSLLNDMLQRLVKRRDTDGHKHTAVGHHKRDIVAFSASKTSSQSLSTGSVIKFDKVWTNFGKGYDPNTGIFTAPVDGVYQFTSTVMPPSSKYLLVHLYHNNVKTTGLYFKAVSGYYNSNTLNIILQVKKGDRISIKSSSSSQSVYSDGNNYNSFSGFLI